MNGQNDIRFERLFRAYYKRIVVYILSVSSFSPSDADDLAQETFKRVYEHMDTFAPESHDAYLKKVAKNVVLNEVRRRHAAMRNEELTRSLEEATGLSSGRATRPDLSAQNRETVSLLATAIRNLPARTRTCMLLFLSGLTYNEIADAQGTTLDAVRACIYEARRRIKEQLPDELKEFELPA